MPLKHELLKVIGVLLIALPIHKLAAQDNTTGKEDAAYSTQRNEVAIDVAPLFRNSSSLDDLHVLYRRYNASGTMALRARIGLNITSSHVESDNLSGGTYSTSSSSVFNPDLRLGVQFNKNIGRARLYYGIDAVLSYAYTHTESDNTRPAPVGYDKIITTSTAKGPGIGAAPVLGIQCFLTKSIALSLENCLNITYTWNKTDNETTRTNGSITQVTSISEGKTKVFSTELAPVRLLSANLSFFF